MKKITFIICLLALACIVPSNATEPPAKFIYEQYLNQAINFAKAYPREKAYLHFDNTSYYVGDTIWFKAYVSMADKPVPTTLSRPLYVELVDQTGHITERQIIKIMNGEGNGQFILSPSMLSGYYEIRAFTRWMLGFKEPQCFSRIFPIYELSKDKQYKRNIATYQLNSYMEQRPEQKEKFIVRFFPESGHLVQGVNSQLAFQAESKTEGNVDVSGSIVVGDSTVTTFHTLHDGMGCFNFVPSAKPALAKVVYKGKKYEFPLPAALPSGYVLSVQNQPGALSFKVACNSSMPTDTMAVFISHNGVPCAYQLVCCNNGTSQDYVIRVRDLPEGVVQFSLINQAGITLCDRFSFVIPNRLDIVASGLKKVYNPYELVQCKLQVNNQFGQPVQGTMSVAVRNAVQSDYSEYDNNMYTDLLLTSDLKGYIHQPGYYFDNMDQEKQRELDVVMMIHGWRKYDMSQQISSQSFKPLQYPETKLTLHGQIRSYVLNNALKNIAVSVIAKADSSFVAGKTVTDTEGRFELPVEDFENTLDAVFQTQKDGKNHKKMTSILLDRNFAPPLTALDYNAIHPQWVNKKEWSAMADKTDSMYMDSLKKAKDVHLLNTVQIVTKWKNKPEDVRTYLRSIDAYYDIRQEVDRLRDTGKEVRTIPELMKILSPSFRVDWRKDSCIFNACTYKLRPIRYILDNEILSMLETDMIASEVDGLKSIVVCLGEKGLTDEIIRSIHGNDSIDIANLDRYAFFYIIPLPYRKIMNHGEGSSYGTRQTVIQGYSHPMEFYSPAYKDAIPVAITDRRRTLYWNPNVKTDSNGIAVIDCYNSEHSSPLIISAETMSEGEVGSISVSTAE